MKLLKGKRIGWPRGENDEDIFAVGNARPLDQALQHATTEMLDWLAADYGLDATAASQPELQAPALAMIGVEGGIFGRVCSTDQMVELLRHAQVVA